MRLKYGSTREFLSAAGSLRGPANGKKGRRLQRLVRSFDHARSADRKCFRYGLGPWRSNPSTEVAPRPESLLQSHSTLLDGDLIVSGAVRDIGCGAFKLSSRTPAAIPSREADVQDLRRRKPRYL